MKLFSWIVLLLCSTIAHDVHSFEANYSIITKDLEARMCYSWKENNPVPLEDLRYIQVSHWGFEDQVIQGELVVHKSVALEVIGIFEELFNAKFPIEKMALIDAYLADDERSMEENNSSAFCSRLMTGSTDRFSKHSYGIAIDINPKINPYVKGTTVLPASGAAYADRNQQVPGMIDPSGICCRLFKEKGWKWGGDWTSLKDYQHFEKSLPQE